jgi:hypothetical protein
MIVMKNKQIVLGLALVAGVCDVADCAPPSIANMRVVQSKDALIAGNPILVPGGQPVVWTTQYQIANAPMDLNIQPQIGRIEYFYIPGQGVVAREQCVVIPLGWGCQIQDSAKICANRLAATFGLPVVRVDLPMPSFSRVPSCCSSPLELLLRCGTRLS